MGGTRRVSVQDLDAAVFCFIGRSSHPPARDLAGGFAIPGLETVARTGGALRMPPDVVCAARRTPRPAGTVIRIAPKLVRIGHGPALLRRSRVHRDLSPPDTSTIVDTRMRSDAYAGGADVLERF